MTTALLIILAVVLAMSMSSKGERGRAFILAFVVLFLSGTQAMQGIHASMVSLMSSFGTSLS
jgi:hypothetical protein